MSQILGIGILFLFILIVVSVIMSIDDIKLGVIIGIAIDILLFIVYMIDKTK